MNEIERWIDDVGPGWRPLVRGLDINLRDLDSDYRIGQIKEKFGGLCYYIAEFKGDADERDNLVYVAEALSFRICEDCGTSGTTKVINGFWLKTLCLHCLERKTREMKALRDERKTIA